jgi:hypothetical protein
LGHLVDSSVSGSAPIIHARRTCWGALTVWPFVAAIG